MTAHTKPVAFAAQPSDIRLIKFHHGVLPPRRAGFLSPATSRVDQSRPQSCRKLIIFAAAAAGATTSDRQKNKGESTNSWSKSGPAWGDHKNFPLRQEMLNCTTASALESLLQLHGPELSPADVAAAWHVAVQSRLLTLARSGDKAEANLSLLLEHLAEQHAQNMDATGLATTAWALAASSSGSAKLIGSILDTTSKRMVNFRPQELCVVLWAASSHEQLRADRRQHAPFIALADLVDAGMQMDHFAAHDLSVLIWSLGRAGFPHTTLLAAAEAESVRKAALFSPADAARTIHGFSMVRHLPVAIMPAFSNEFRGRMEEFSPEDITLFMVSLGKLSMEPDGAFIKAVVRAAAKLVPPPAKKPRKTKKPATSSKTGGEESGSAESGPAIKEDANTYLHPHHMAHIMWTLARIDHRPAETGFMLRMMRHLESYPGLYSAEDINVILWASSRLQLDVPAETIAAAASRLAVLASYEDPEVVSGCLRYMSSLVSRSPALLQGAAGHAIHVFVAAATEAMGPALREMDADDLSGMIVALGTLESDFSEQFSAMLQKACIAAAPDMPSTALPKVAWAVVRLRWSSTKVLDMLAAATAAKIGLLPPSGLAQSAWAFAATNRNYPDLAHKLVDQCSSKLNSKESSFDPRDKARLVWAFAQISRHGYPPQSFLMRLLHSITAVDLSKMDSVGVSAVIWMCGRLDEHPGRVLDDALEVMSTNAPLFSRSHLQQAKLVIGKHACRNAAAVETISRLAASPMNS